VIIDNRRRNSFRVSIADTVANEPDLQAYSILSVVSELIDAMLP